MHDLHIWPVFAKVLGDESPMTMLGRILTAQQTIAIEEFPGERFRNSTRFH